MKPLYLTRFLLVLSLLFSAVASNAAGNNLTTKTDSSAIAKTTAKPAAKKADPDTAWKPVRRIWGYSFGDFYYDAHTDAGGRGGETNYAGVPTYRNAFQFRRLYLGYDYDITKKFSATLLLASEPTASTSASGTTSIQNNDNLVDGKMSFFIKQMNLRVRDLWSGTDFVIGEMATPTWSFLPEQVWGYRFDERTIADLHKLGNSYDVGAALQGTFDPATKNFGYNFMVGNNSQAVLANASSPNTGFYKQFYGDIWGKFLDQRIIVDLYDDYVRTAAATFAVGGQAHSLTKGMLAYSTPKFTLGVEAFTEKITNGVDITPIGGTSKTAVNATAQGISIYSHGAIYKDKLGYFVRYDTYNPDKDFDSGDTYAVNTNISSYTPYQKEQFYNLGIDYTPAKNIHFAPNVWLYEFKDQRASTTTGYLPNDHTLIYRLTFFFTFGK